MSNFYERFAAAASRFPNRVAVEVQRRDGLDSFTYDRLSQNVGHIAAWLTQRGIQPDERCCILAENDGYWCAAYLAILRMGAVAVPLDTAYKVTQVATLLRDSDAKLIFTSPRH